MGCCSSKSDSTLARENSKYAKEADTDSTRRQNNFIDTNEYLKKDKHNGMAKDKNGRMSKHKNDDCPENMEIQQESIEDADKDCHFKTDTTNEYLKIDEHARKAPSSMRTSPELVEYLSSVSRDPKILVRGFYVWISENIRYDVDGYFGRSAMAPCDGQSVLTSGRSVCDGYASAFKLLCRDAEIPVRKISGYAKGFSYSTAKPITLDQKTNHAWNAVQLEGKWHLIDCTWGAGHVVRKTKDFKKVFDEFYFLTEPKEFICNHFPYMDNNIEESMKWQLLSEPITLEEFSSGLKYSPQAFKLGIVAVSHKKAYFEMKNELEMSFKSGRKEDISLSSRLTLEKGQEKENNTTFCYQENGVYKIRVHPQKTGIYTLDIFGEPALSETNVGGSHLIEYKINCTQVWAKNHEYPTAYKATFVEKCLLHEPLIGRLPANTDIQFCISTPQLQEVMIHHNYFEKQGTMFIGNITTPCKGQKVNLFGKKAAKESKWIALYSFQTI